MFRFELVEAVTDEYVNDVAGAVLARAVDADGWLADPLLPERRALVLHGCPAEVPVSDLRIEVYDGSDRCHGWDLVDPVVHAELGNGDVVLSAAVCLRANFRALPRKNVLRPHYRLFQGGRFVGSCRAVDGLPEDDPLHRWPPVTLIGCDQPDRIRDAEAVNQWGGIRALADDGRPMSFSLLKFVVAQTRPSVLGQGLFDIVLDQSAVTWTPDYYDERPGPTSRPVWELWRAGIPQEKNLWAPFDSAGRRAWLALTHGNQKPVPDQTGVRHLDGRFATDPEGVHLALAEAMAGPGGYFGRNLADLADLLDFTGFTLVWHDAQVAHDADRDYFVSVLERLRAHRVNVELDSTLDAVVSLDRLSALRPLAARWCRAWAKAAGLAVHDGRQRYTQVVVVNEPDQRYERVVTDTPSEIGWTAAEMALSPHPEQLTVPTNAPEAVTRAIAHEGLHILPQETFMRRALDGHPAPQPPEGYSVEVTPGDVIEVVVTCDGEEAAGGSMAVIGEDAVPCRVRTSPEHRRRGLGSVVMGVLAREAVAVGATRGLLFATAEGLHLYRKLGWDTISDVVIARGKHDR